MKLSFNEQIFNKLVNSRQLFDHSMALRGEVFKASPQRIVYRFVHNQRAYFIKIHSGVGWREIIKNWLQLKFPVVDASNEWWALERLQGLAIPSLLPVGFGCEGINPARRRSFIITRELQDTISLEEITRSWSRQKPPVILKHALIAALADVMRKMHQGGINHRDCYLCHFRLNVQGGVKNLRPERLILHVIDLHRAQCRQKVPARWLSKDLAGLYFSSLQIGLSRRDVYRFITQYTQQTLEQEFKANKKFWRNVESRALALQKKHSRPEC